MNAPLRTRAAAPLPAHPARAHGGDRRVGALDRRALGWARDRGAGDARRVGRPPGRYVAKVTVRPGQSLWSLAEAYDPDADPRLVIQEIQQLNSMTGDQVQPGEVLWVPRG